MKSANLPSVIEKTKKIQCLICDVDGVLTNGFLYIDINGNESKAFHVLDGMGLKLLMSAGIEVAIITTSNNAVIDERMKQLGIQHFYKGQTNKQKAYESLKKNLNLPDEAFAYVGDDLPDLPIIQQVGLGVAVGSAVDQVKQAADLITTKDGGFGGVRELCDYILATQDKFNLALDHYLSA
ncbi:MAG: HAD-IIIA family hydrolase [Legionella sp.]|jgi:3-deoxy-D-manno-octulosonate 8-phosphate phosphatase (KDO 8-P phosphatase)|nr:HAD-IIIA family hydrolase [Legionella sp.]